MRIEPNSPVGEVVAGSSQAAETFESLGVDYCCGGDSLAEACRRAGQDVEAVIRMLEASERGGAKPAKVGRWEKEPLSALTSHIVRTHHAFTRDALVRLDGLLRKVRAKHGDKHAEVARIESLVKDVDEELSGHMLREERILFPYIVELERAFLADEPAPESPFGTVRNPVRTMMDDHELTGETLHRIREAASNYRPPADASAAFEPLYECLRDLEKDLHQHMYLENFFLFPRAVDLEDRAAMVTVSR